MIYRFPRVVIFVFALVSALALAQQRREPDARANVNLDELTRRPESRAPEAASIPRIVHRPARATQQARAAAAVTTPRDSVPSAPAAATGAVDFTGFQALLDNFTAVPPDTNGAVGPRDVVTMLNTQVLIQSRAGTPRSGYPISLNGARGFWSPLGSFSDIFDPHIAYDAANDRWLACSALNGNKVESALLVGVSQTGDPGGAWNLYKINVNDASATAATAFWGDYPLLGFNGRWVVVSLNLFRVSQSASGARYVHTNLYVFDKSDLYQNGKGAFTLFDSDREGEFIPALDFDNHADTMYFVQTEAGDIGFADGVGTIRVSRLQGAVGSESFRGGNAGTITINDAWSDEGNSGSDFAPQLGASAQIDTGDSRLQNCVMRGGTVWCAHTVFLPFGAPTRSAVQWFQIDPAAPSLLQRGRIDDPANTFFYAYPSLAVNRNNDVLIGFNRFSANDYPSAEFAFRTASDPPNTLEPDIMFKAGESPYTNIGSRSGSNRWGDYSATWVDPVDDLTFWTVQEYAATPTAGQRGMFGTWWAEVTAPSAGTQPSGVKPAFPEQGLVSAASFKGGAVAPGELITLFGTNLGPATGQKPLVGASGAVNTIAGGTRVLFDGTPAPMVYSSSSQVNAVVPFAVQGHATTQVQVDFLGTRSDPITIPVVAAAPAIFSLEASGRGPGAILNNADFSVNSPTRPAARGSAIAVYATGGGVVAGSIEGTIARRASDTSLSGVTARIGGVPAQVLYAGVAPGIIVGVLQINVVVPTGVAPGSALPIDITIGGVTSPAGVTVAVQ